MLFVCELTIPAATGSDDPVEGWYPICAGTITRVRVHWPWGAGNLAGCRILHEEMQRWPLSMMRWFNSSTRDLEFAENYEVSADDPRLKVTAYNDDDTFAHTVTVYIEVTRRSALSQVAELLSFGGLEVVHG